MGWRNIKSEMKNILIIGARGYGRECDKGLRLYPEYNKEFTIKGFLDDKKTALDNFEGYPPIISSVEDYEIQRDDMFLCALGDVHAKVKYIELIKNKGGNFITLVDATSIVYDVNQLGEGVIISPFCIISANVKIGDFTTVQAYSNLGHDSKVGKYCSVESYSFLGGFAQIGDFTTLHTRSTILPHIKIGDNVIVGAGSVVIKNVKAGISVFGIPAKKLEF
jgi:sugar O-acyltransferase (sialic acid O-acetyltransferase NeuD family)